MNLKNLLEMREIQATKRRAIIQMSSHPGGILSIALGLSQPDSSIGIVGRLCLYVWRERDSESFTSINGPP